MSCAVGNTVDNGGRRSTTSPALELTTKVRLDLPPEMSETETIKCYGVNQTHTVTYEYNAAGNRTPALVP